MCCKHWLKHVTWWRWSNLFWVITEFHKNFILCIISTVVKCCTKILHRQTNRSCKVKSEHLHPASTSALKPQMHVREQSLLSAPSPSAAPSPVPAWRTIKRWPSWCLHPEVDPSSSASSSLADWVWTDLFFWCLQSVNCKDKHWRQMTKHKYFLKVSDTVHHSQR